jgi:putative transposase
VFTFRRNGCSPSAVPDVHLPAKQVFTLLRNGCSPCAVPDVQDRPKPADSWAYRSGVRLDFIRPGKPVKNAYIESFNGRLRDECLNGALFFSVDDARTKLLEWKRDYNERRPHGSIGNQTPTEFANAWAQQPTAEASFSQSKTVHS